MKHAKGAGGASGTADDDDFQVVPVESTSEYEKFHSFQVLSWSPTYINPNLSKSVSASIYLWTFVASVLLR